MMKLWLYLESRGVGIRNFFLDNGIERIAIFGMGDHGEFVCNFAKSAGIQVVSLMDPARARFGEETVYPLTAYERLHDADAIIVCRETKAVMDPQTFDAEMWELYRNTDIPIYGIKTVLEWCLFKHCLIPWLNGAGTENNSVLYLPNAMDLRDEAHYNQEEWAYRGVRDHFFKDTEWRKRAYGELDADLAEYFAEVAYSPTTIRRNGRVGHLDHAGRFLNIVNGKRLTLGNPCNPDNSIHIFGNSVAFASFVDDGRTAASFMRQICRRHGKYENTMVVNQAVNGFSISTMNLEYFRVVENSGMRKGDSGCFIIAGTVATPEPLRFWRDKAMRPYFRKMGLQVFDALDRFRDMQKTEELFFDRCHFAVPGLKLLAQIIFDSRENPGGMSEIMAPDRGTALDNPGSSPARSGIPAGLADFLKAITGKAIRKNGSTMGAVVINGNPFTLGHRYLLEQALRHCDFLYCFVVEEDKSHFPFRDRIELIKKGTEDLPNIMVLPSGEFIISSITFPGYFSKEDAGTAKVDCSRDVETFAKYIAPALGITRRFAGSEPFCQVTLQYNNEMRRILPQYGIEFIEFQRLGGKDGDIISASRVRGLMAEKNWRELEALVPPSIFSYLKRK